jgi:hypothetical protein
VTEAQCGEEARKFLGGKISGEDSMKSRPARLGGGLGDAAIAGARSPRMASISALANVSA